MGSYRPNAFYRASLCCVSTGFARQPPVLFLITFWSFQHKFSRSGLNEELQMLAMLRGRNKPFTIGLRALKVDILFLIVAIKGGDSVYAKLNAACEDRDTRQSGVRIYIETPRVRAWPVE